MKHQTDCSMVLKPLHAITLHEFNELSKAHKTELIWDKGFIIGDRSDEKYFYVLYSVLNFYVEIKYLRESIIDIFIIKSIRQLRLHPVWRKLPSYLISSH